MKRKHSHSDTAIIPIGDKTYHVGYDYFYEERDIDHHAPEKIEITELYDELGEQPEDEILLEQIEKEIWQAIS